ncbi:class I SAM-dependent rRNA methyltransferase [Geoalkalibacter halelectricus]|uniref:class I SAM-dependent rRNA methyltransferase n=1 Tax=Geoalkalibacter halelectricus TaxID=2847045 RepID=UPI003D2508CD
MARSFVVGPETVRMLELGHPWVIADRHTKRWAQARAGEVAALTDQSGRFLATALMDPGDRVVARVLDFAPLRFDGPWLRERLSQAQARRRQADLEDSTAYRLVNGEGDGLPGLVVERYGDFLLVQLYSRAWEAHLDLLTAALAEIVRPTGIYLKTRPRQTRDLAAKGQTGKLGRLVWGKQARFPLRVSENGLTFLVDLQEGLHSGLFLDQRRNRRDFMNRVAGRTVLNLFAFTGAFSVAAAASGASQVTSVDAAGAYLERAEENFRVNGLDPSAHEFLTGDCFRVLDELVRAGRRFETVLMDPPSFSTTRQSRFTTRGGTSDLVAQSLRLLPPGGLLICSSNHQKVDLADFLKEIRRGALQGGRDLRVLATYAQPEDFPYPVTFPEGRYLKYLVMEAGAEPRAPS